jgi:hypothetical protein
MARTRKIAPPVTDALVADTGHFEHVRALAAERTGPGARVEERLVEGARSFITIGPDAFVWMVLEAQHLPPNIKGSFVRLEPRDVSTDEEVARVRGLCEAAGALRVMVLPRRKGATVLAPREKRPHRRARDVVAELVREANVREEDRSALAEFCETIMSRRSL